MMKIQTFGIALVLICLFSCTSNQEKGTRVLLKTTQGNIKLRLYDDTPLHRDNFVRLVNSGELSKTLFHRVVKNFMIQAGNAPTDSSAIGVSSELKNSYPHRFHKRGVLSAARWDGERNPAKLSETMQFYIVTGEKFSSKRLSELEKDRLHRLRNEIFESLQWQKIDSIQLLKARGDESELDELAHRLADQTVEIADQRKDEYIYTDDQRKVYKEVGGAPHLDNIYTVFGEVTDGMDVVDKIENMKVDVNNTPLEKIIIEIEILK